MNDFEITPLEINIFKNEFEKKYGVQPTKQDIDSWIERTKENYYMGV